MFSDASQDAISHVTYIKSVDETGNISVAFVTGDSKVAPRAASIPRLELCAAVEVAQAAREIIKELTRVVDKVFYYTDSKVVLGYLMNTERRFSKYVSQRVAQIMNFTNNTAWAYVATHLNPADMASHPYNPDALIATPWLQGPAFLSYQDYTLESPHPLSPENLPELQGDKLDNKVLTTIISGAPSIFTDLTNKISSWSKMIRIANLVITTIQNWLHRTRCRLYRPESQLTDQLKKRSGRDELIKVAQESC